MKSPLCKTRPIVLPPSAWQSAEFDFLQSEDRSPRRILRPAPRSKSEGPLASDNDEFMFRGSEYKTQFAKGNKPVVKGPVKCSIRSLGRGPETTPLLLPEKVISFFPLIFSVLS